ncbi:glycosyl transferase family 2 [Pararhodobacter marinus]|uniref:Glycosyl transferase family 2 n=1 Tax=Pararhodobacter marinus TaxID=2184063 RepID=A0A2U2CIX2_9RHOB|nr:glycosyltransferase family 2 protein [Pararhodobacter marinus]PWE31816.1 glycosyl transferase family 2 [Pararhodobacter marinus]
MPSARSLWSAYKWRRRRQLRIARAFLKRRELAALADRTDQIAPGDVLAFTCLRNEVQRLPYFLCHYRGLGVRHFLVVDNDSDDGSGDYLAAQPDVSLWHTRASYRAARFGVDWMMALMQRHGVGHWCLGVDADELLVYPHHDTRPLPALCEFLEAEGEVALGALMLDLYPEGPLDEVAYRPGQNPVEALGWYDRGNYTIVRKPDTGALWIQGGPRPRMFFADRPERGPTLTKIPLVKWHWRYAYLNSTHVMLPRWLNGSVYETGGGEKLSGVLLHTKFLPGIDAKSAEEKTRRQHFGEPGAFDDYYDALTRSPDLWTASSTRYRDWRQLEAEGLMSRGGWG